MAKCDLTIEIDRKLKQFIAGETIRGRLTVKANESIKCDALTIVHSWSTHGRGNIASGKGAVVTLFSGQFAPGDVRHYDFAIETLEWPPTYHGHYLNIDHAVQATVSIPWAFDIEASTPITIIGPAKNGATSANPVTNIKAKSSGKTFGIGAIVVALLATALFAVVIPLLLFIVPIIAVVAACVWFFGSFLPKQKIGNAQCKIASNQLRLGDLVQANLHISPKKELRINGITATVTGEEVCVSGSGSNRKTHTHSIFKRDMSLVGAGMLPAGVANYPIEIPLPVQGPPTLELGDNKIKWSLNVCVDIPQWPDFRHVEVLNVGLAPTNLAADQGPNLENNSDVAIPLDPALQMGAEPAYGTEPWNPPYSLPTNPLGRATDPTVAPASVEAQGAEEAAITFTELANFLIAAEGDHEQIDTLIEAVQGLEFAISAAIERFVLYAGIEDQKHAYPQGRTAYAEDLQSELLLTLYFAPADANTVDLQEKQTWNGRAVVVGYDFQHGRLRLKVSN